MWEYVFGYGSLVVDAPGGFVATLRGVSRGWGVAMDNRDDLPGYKYYLDRDLHRPAVSVCFLDIDSDAPASARVNGVCVPVGTEELHALDRRERNYDRIDVTDRLTGGGEGRVWTYRGSRDGRARFDTAVRAGTAVIHAGYLEIVRDGFRALGEDEWSAAAPSLQPGDLPVIDLARQNLG